MCWWMMSWIVAQATQQEKIKFLYQDQIHKATESLFCTIAYVSFVIWSCMYMYIPLILPLILQKLMVMHLQLYIT